MQLQLFRSQLRIRMVEEHIASHYGEQKMRCPVHLSIGQEAVAVGVCAALQTQDLAISTHRSHAHYLAKGGSLTAMVAEILGKATGCSAGKGGSMHLIDLECGFLGSTPIVGATIPIGTGAALAAKLEGSGKVVAVFFGEGATEEGVFFESINFAALHNLPVLFVCENNRYSVYSPLSVRQPRERDLLKMVAANGVSSSREDGSDVNAVHAIAAAAVADIRGGAGPSLLEFSTYRYLEHCGPQTDDHLNYRPAEEVEHWKARCPVKLEQARLLKEGALSEEELARIVATVEREIHEAFEAAEAAPFPCEQELFTEVFA